MTAIEKALQVLGVLTREKRAMALSEVIGVVGLPKPSVRRLLVELMNDGLVFQNADRKYELGNTIADLAARAVVTEALAAALTEPMKRLELNVTGTISLCQAIDGRLSELARLNASATPFGVDPALDRPLIDTAPGRALLSYLPVADRERLAIAHPEVAISEILDTTRERRYALDNEENRQGVRVIATAICLFTGRPVGTLSLSVAAKLVSLPELLRMSAELVAAADQISAQLGASAEMLEGDR